MQTDWEWPSPGQGFCYSVSTRWLGSSSSVLLGQLSGPALYPSRWCFCYSKSTAMKPQQGQTFRIEGELFYFLSGRQGSFWDSLCILDWLETGLKLAVMLLPLPLECWDYRHVPPCSALAYSFCKFFLKHLFHVCICVYVLAHVEVRWQPAGVSSLHSLCGLWELNSGH